MASEQLVKDCAESVNICRASDARVISHRLFRRHVTRSAQNFHRARDGAFGFHQSCEPKIGEMWFALCVEQDVSGFDISMEDAALMRIGNGAGQLGDQFRCVTDRHRFALRDGIELAALHQSHAEVTGAISLADFINWNDARMVETGGGFCLQTETLEMLLRGPLAETDNFYCNCAVETLLSRAKHNALTAS